MTKLKRWDLCLRSDPYPISTPCLPNSSENGSCAPYVEVTNYLLSCLLERKKRELCFCHWFSHMKLISSPFSGSEAAVSRSAISLCFVSVSAGEILNSLCTKLFKFYIILKLCFFGVGAHRPPHLAESALCRLWSGSVLIFKSPFPSPVPPFWRGFHEVC